MTDAPGPRPRWLGGALAALLLTGLFLALVPALVAGEDFIAAARPDWRVLSMSGPAAWGGRTETYVGFVVDPYGEMLVVPPTSLLDLVRSDAAWAAAAVALVLAPVLFLRWRLASSAFARAAGFACCAAAAIGVCSLVLARPDVEIRPLGWTWCWTPLGAALMASVFVAEAGAARAERPSPLRDWIALTAMGVGAVLALLPAIVTDDAYLRRTLVQARDPVRCWAINAVEMDDCFGLLGNEPAWTAIAASLVVLPLWWWHWRRTEMTGARALGIAVAVATAAGIQVLAHFVARLPVDGAPLGLFKLHFAAALCFAAAFAVAAHPAARESP